MPSPAAPSLRRKIFFGYVIVAALILGVSLFTFQELKLVEDRILLGERISELFDTALEIRRFERNYFLHRQASDLDENGRYLGQLREAIERNRADFVLLRAQPRIGALRERIDAYAALMERYAAATPTQRVSLEAAIRAAGKDIVAAAEEMVASERRLVRESLTNFRTVLVFAVAALALLMVGLGQALSRKVAQPLRQLEDSVNAVSSGMRDKLASPSRDSEIAAIVNAVNHLLKELEVRQKHLLRTEKLTSLGTMLSGVAHELNNPLSNIWSACQLLLEELGEADVEAQRELLTRIDEQGERARNIVRSLLDFARDAGFSKQPVRLRELVDQTVRFLKGQVPAGVGVTVEIPEDLAVPADRQRLQQAMLNLIKNAIDAVGERGEVSVAARRMEGEDGPVVDIAVRDSGSGIAPEALPRIFDPFFTTKEVGKGMGLGLFIVHQIVEEHDGSIAATSEKGRGTEFRLRLPCGEIAA